MQMMYFITQKPLTAFHLSRGCWTE